jgi:hypothetical protein
VFVTDPALLANITLGRDKHFSYVCPFVIDLVAKQARVFEKVKKNLTGTITDFASWS